MFQSNLPFIFQNFISPGAKNLNFDAKIARNAPLPFWVWVSMIDAVVEKTTEHVSIKLTFYFSKFHKSRHEKPPFFGKNDSNSGVPFPVWVRLRVIGTVARSYTKHVPSKLTFVFPEIFQVQEPKTTFLMLHTHFRSTCWGNGDERSVDCR